MVDRLVFVRHAESTFSARGLGNGDPTLDGPLTERGRKQARQLRDLVGREAFDVCVTTGFRRTQETADIALGGSDVRRVIEEALNDPRLGVFESRPLDEFLAWLGSHDWATRPNGGGESQLDSIRRFVDGFERLLAREESRVLVIGHNFPMAVAHALANEPPPVVRPRYTASFDHIQPIDIEPSALARGVTRARRELAELGPP